MAYLFFYSEFGLIGISSGTALASVLHLCFILCFAVCNLIQFLCSVFDWNCEAEAAVRREGWKKKNSIIRCFHIQVGEWALFTNHFSYGLNWSDTAARIILEDIRASQVDLILHICCYWWSTFRCSKECGSSDFHSQQLGSQQVSFPFVCSN